MDELTWVFDPVPPSGKREGGDVAYKAFDGEGIANLTREVIQNSSDNKNINTEGPVKIKFRLKVLSGELLDAFKEAIKWDYLVDNLEAIPAERQGGAVIRKALENLDEKKELRILVIEDSNTSGLTGAEDRIEQEPNKFRSLTHDDMYSDKDNESAGGGHGVGKTMLSAFSSFKTVLFGSILTEYPDDKEGTRFIGSTILPYHETEHDGPTSGDGWLGVPKGQEGAKKAESYWSDGADGLDDTFCDRDEPGTSIVIVGFSEPAVDDDESEPSAQIKAIEKATVDNFWPAIIRNQIEVEGSYENNFDVKEKFSADPRKDESLKPFIELLEKYDRGELSEKNKLAENDSCYKKINLTVPERFGTETTQPHERIKADTTLLVHLLEDDKKYNSVKDKIYRFRGPGMIVRKDTKKNISVNARTYIAILLCGLAQSKDENSKRSDAFLKACEPPKHDTFSPYADGLKGKYNTHGVKAILETLDADIKKALKKLISVPEKSGGKLPKNLLKYLKFGKNTGGGQKRVFSVSNLKHLIKDGAYSFTGSVRRITNENNEDAQKILRVSFRLVCQKDGGGGDIIKAIEKVECDKAESTDVENGIGHINFAADTDKVNFTIITNKNNYPLTGSRSAMALRVDGIKIIKGES